MNTKTHSTQGPLARFGQRMIALVAELNYAQNRVANAQHTPEHY
ncbi:MAG TPA: hypothetical protein VGD68_02670 [Streptosporangiaceae bacterium]